MSFNKKTKRWLSIAGIVAALLVVLGIVGFQAAKNILRKQIVDALGPDSEVQTIGFNWSGVEIIGLRVHAPKGWPATDVLRAERIVVIPDLRSLLSSQYRVQSIRIEKPYLSVLRAKDGRVRVLPGLIDRPAKKNEEGAFGSLAVFIGGIKLQDGVLEFFDATIRQPALKLRLEQMQAQVDELRLPALTGHTPFQLDGVLKGVHRDGNVSIAGWAEMADRNSSVTTKLHGVDLVTLQPYLIKASETGVRKGTLDLDLKSNVHRNRLEAPGVMTLSGLELTSADRGWSTFMGVPRQAIIGFLKDKNDQIAVRFLLKGDLNDPKFSLNEDLATRIASSMAEGLGVSLKGVAGGVESVGQKGLEAAGSALGRLFRK